MSWDVPVALRNYRGPDDHALREGHLALLQGSTTLVPCMVTLTKRCFVYAVNGVDETTILWDHIVGCHCLRGRHGTGRSAYFCVYTYQPMRLKKCGMVRRQQLITFAVDVQNNYADNMELAKTWQTNILDCISRSIPEGLRIKRAQRPYLVFVNRKSGPGRAFSIFEKNVNPVFAASDVPYELVITERQNHAREVVRSVDPHLYRGIVLVSGDGLIFEVINGIFERPDWRTAVPELPIGVVAGGSGNGLAGALLHVSGLSMVENLHTHCALMLAKPMIQPMDVVLVETMNERLVSFLSVTWAMIADIDIQSERLRSLGGARFTVAAVAKILGSRIYRARLSFLPHGSYIPEERLPQQRRTSQSRLSRSSSVVANGHNCNGPRMHHSESLYTNNVIDDGSETEEDDVFKNQHNSRAGRTLSLSGVPSGVLTSIEEVENAYDAMDLDDMDRRPRPPPVFTADSEKPEEPVHTVSIPRRRLPPLSEPLPDNWVSITDDFIVFCAAYQSHIATDAHILPMASIDDNLIHLVLVRSGVPRSTLFGIMTNIERGLHVKSPFLEVIPVYAFRLEPITPDGIIAVDGERVQYGPIQAEVAEEKVPVVTNCQSLKNCQKNGIIDRRHSTVK